MQIWRQEVSEEPSGVGAGLALDVDLSRYYSDERRLVRVWAPRGDTVRALLRRLRRRWRLRGGLALQAVGALLHPAEPLAALRGGDAIRVIPLESPWFSESSDDGDVAPPPSPPSPLQHVKRRALAALDAVLSGAGAGGGGGEGTASSDVADRLQTGAATAVDVVDGGGMNGFAGSVPSSASVSNSGAKRRRVRRRPRAARQPPAPPPPPPLPPPPPHGEGGRTPRVVHSLCPPTPEAIVSAPP